MSCCSRKKKNLVFQWGEILPTSATISEARERERIRRKMAAEQATASEPPEPEADPSESA